MKVTEKDREAAREFVRDYKVRDYFGLGKVPQMELEELLAAAYARGLEDAAKRAIETRSCTHDHAPGECEECHWVARIAAAIRKLGEDA